MKIPKGYSESVNWRRTDNTMAKSKSTKGQTMIYKTYTLNQRSKIVGSTKNRWTPVLRKSRQFLLNSFICLQSNNEIRKWGKNTNNTMPNNSNINRKIINRYFKHTSTWTFLLVSWVNSAWVKWERYSGRNCLPLWSAWVHFRFLRGPYYTIFSFRWYVL